MARVFVRQAGSVVGVDGGWALAREALPPAVCLSFVRGLDPDEVIARLGGAHPVAIIGAQASFTADEAVEERVDEAGASHSSGLFYVAVTRLMDWTMIVEPNGFLGVGDDEVRVLSGAGEMVSFYFNENTTPRFCWAVGGRLVVGFDPGYPEERYGSDPSRLDALLTELGFPMGEDSDFDAEFQERTLALMARITGVRWDSGFLETATFRCAGVGGPGSRVVAEPWYGEVRDQLAAYADDQYDDTDPALDKWGPREVYDRRIRALGSAGASVYDTSPDLAAAIAYAPEELVDRMTRWATERPFRRAGVSDEPWLTPILDLVHRRQPVPERDVETVQERMGPYLRTVSPLYGRDEYRNNAARNLLVLYDSEGAVAALCWKLAGTGAGPLAEAVADLRREFPELADVAVPPPPPAPVELAAQRRKRQAREQQEERWRIADLTKWWGGRIPDDQVLRPEVAVYARTLVEHDRDLIDRIVEASPSAQRAIAVWAAHNCCARAGLLDRDWVRAGLDALDRGEPTPPPWFEDFTAAYARWRDVPVESIVFSSSFSLGPSEREDRPRIDPAIAALLAVVTARHDDVLVAAFDAVRCVVQLDPDDPATPLADLRQAFNLT